MQIKDIEELLIKYNFFSAKESSVNKFYKLAENDWLDILEYLVKKLSEATSSHIYIGTYWISSEIDSSSLVARVKSKSPLPNVESNYWEAVLCLSSDERKSWSDVYLFPFFDGLRVSKYGKFDNDEAINKGDDIFWWYQFKDGEFLSKEWFHGDGPGEWAWVLKPGDEYPCNLKCNLVESETLEGEPIYLDITIPNLQSILASTSFNKNNLRISLIHVNRGHENKNLVPWNAFPPKTNSQHTKTLDDVKVINSDIVRVDLRTFTIRSKWKSGKYLFSVRLQNSDEDWNTSSSISKPISLIIR